MIKHFSFSPIILLSMILPQFPRPFAPPRAYKTRNQGPHGGGPSKRNGLPSVQAESFSC